MSVNSVLEATKIIGQRKALSRVYSSTNWSLFTGGQNSILNWVLKYNPINQKIKK